MKKQLFSVISIICLLVSIALPFSTTASTVDYAQTLRDKGFPESYINDLVELHNKYPKWEFEPLLTGINWQTAINGERASHTNNLIQKLSSFTSDYYCSCSSCMKNGSYIIQEGTNWICASESALKYYMDPRNWLSEKCIFQFESTAYNSAHTKSGVESILKYTWMYNSLISYVKTDGTTRECYDSATKYSDAIMTAAKESGMSAYYLASRIVQEVGCTTAITGGSCGTKAPYYGIYNYYNIGAYTGAMDGLSWAASSGTYGRPWTTPYKSIINGAKWIATGYSKTQHTGYLQKYNVNPASANLYGHQYMTNVGAPSAESVTTYNGYKCADLLNTSKTFAIPVYLNMPASACKATDTLSTCPAQTTTKATTTSTTKATTTTTAYTLPSKPSVTSIASNNTKRITLKWKKVTSSGYQIQYSKNKYCTSDIKNVYVSSSTTSKTLSAAKSKTLYYVRIRSYQTKNGKKVYSSWSPIKSIKTK